MLWIRGETYVITTDRWGYSIIYLNPKEEGDEKKAEDEAEDEDEEDEDRDPDDPPTRKGPRGRYTLKGKQLKKWELKQEFSIREVHIGSLESLLKAVYQAHFHAEDILTWTELREALDRGEAFLLEIINELDITERVRQLRLKSRSRIPILDPDQTALPTTSSRKKRTPRKKKESPVKTSPPEPSRKESTVGDSPPKKESTLSRLREKVPKKSSD